jgi:hypothetical protein
MSADVLRKWDRCVSEVREMRLWPEDMGSVSTILYLRSASMASITAGLRTMMTTWCTVPDISDQIPAGIACYRC